jgi:hypothetical protein
MPGPQGSWPPADPTTPPGEPAAVLLNEAGNALGKNPPECSQRLLDSLLEVQELEERFIDLRPASDYQPADYLDSRAFVVLVHGVVEDYLEGIVLEVADSALRGFAADSIPRSTLLALLAHTPSATARPPEQRGGGPWLVRDAISKARDALVTTTRDNQGIKERHVLSLVLPVGIKESDLSTTWLSYMTDLGEVRGRVAHSGRPRPGASTPLDPGDALKAGRFVLPGLCRLDRRLVLLRDEA